MIFHVFQPKEAVFKKGTGDFCLFALKAFIYLPPASGSILSLVCFCYCCDVVSFLPFSQAAFVFFQSHNQTTTNNLLSL